MDNAIARAERAVLLAAEKWERNWGRKALDETWEKAMDLVNAIRVLRAARRKAAKAGRVPPHG